MWPKTKVPTGTQLTARQHYQLHQCHLQCCCCACRFVFGLGGLVLLCLALPYCCGSITALLAATAAVGVCYSIAFGTSYQLVTHFPPGCTVALTTGANALANLACLWLQLPLQARVSISACH